MTRPLSLRELTVTVRYPDALYVSRQRDADSFHERRMRSECRAFLPVHASGRPRARERGWVSQSGISTLKHLTDSPRISPYATRTSDSESRIRNSDNASRDPVHFHGCPRCGCVKLWTPCGSSERTHVCYLEAGLRTSSREHVRESGCASSSVGSWPCQCEWFVLALEYPGSGRHDMDTSLRVSLQQ
jgi:hypothetical protein